MRCIRFVIVLAASAGLFTAQAGEPLQGTYQRVKVHGKSLEGNLSREPVVGIQPLGGPERVVA